MANYIRAQYNHPDDHYFLTLVTRNRTPFFASEDNRSMVVDFLHQGAKEATGELIAWVVMPDHLHCLVRQGKQSFSRWIASFKRRVNREITPRDGTIWQNRFWEHRVRDNADLWKHIDYIHANPVRAGLVEDPLEYEASSFRLFVERGDYPQDWMCESIEEDGSRFGE